MKQVTTVVLAWLMGGGGIVPGISDWEKFPPGEREPQWRLPTAVPAPPSLPAGSAAAAAASVKDAVHVTVRHEKGRSFGWPANGGLWSWGDEILVQYRGGEFQDKPVGSHDIDDNKPITVEQSRSFDGGHTWTQHTVTSIPITEKHDVALMPSTVRVSPSKLVCCIRNLTAYPKKGWIDCRVSLDNGRTWRLKSTPVGDEAGTTPPALMRLADGRLVLTYGHRKPIQGPTSIRAKVSEDEGATWGGELILRTGGGDEDIGYTRNALRPDGKVVTIYYWQEDEKTERRIEATIWTPPARGNHARGPRE